MKKQPEERVFTLLRSAKAPKSAKEVAVALSIEEEQAKRQLDNLLEKGKILRTRRGKYALPAHVGASTGRIVGLRRGDAFFVPDDGGQELFIRERERNSAMHGDAVVVRRMHSGQARRGRRINGEVVCVTERANETVVGTLQRNNGGGVVTPDDRRLCEVEIPSSALSGAHSCQMVIARITDYGSAETPVKGEIVRVLGEEGTLPACVAGIVHEYGFEEQFPADVLGEATAAARRVSEKEAAFREDFRALTTVTIDGADAKDFDDAISLTQTDAGTVLYVHIADVTHYVKPETALDVEGYRRATSVYFPGRALPMLPEALSNGICSLKEGEDRLCLSCVMDLDHDAKVMRYRFARSVIRVDKRVIYAQANALFATKDAKLLEQHRAVWPMLKSMRALARVLTKARMARGALDFDIAEPVFTLNEEGQPVDVGPSERGVSNVMIEEFMLLANECAAKLLNERNLPALYRVHEEPEKDRIESFSLLLKALGLPGIGKKQRVTPRTLQSILKRVAGAPHEMVINRVMLRSLQKAKYSQKPLGHFGLALKDYCHFTSPIRRYPDIVVHRAIIASLQGGLGEKALEGAHAKMQAMAEHTSERERASMEAERAVDDLYAAAYMQDKLGQEYAGHISGVTEFGLFVEILGVIEGMIPIMALGGDVFEHDALMHRITGKHSGERYALGDAIDIVVAGVDLTRRRIDFALKQEEKAPKSVAGKAGKTGRKHANRR